MWQKKEEDKGEGGGKRETMAQGEEGNAKKELELRDENKKILNFIGLVFVGFCL